MPDTANSTGEAKTEPKMARPSDAPRSWLVPIATVALLAVAFCLYYFVYVGARREYLVNRNFRSLAALGDQIQRVISTHGSILDFYSEFVAGNAAREQDRAKAKLSTYLLTRPEDKDREPKTRELESRMDYLRYLAPKMKLIEEPIVANGQASKPPPALDVLRHDGSWKLLLRASRHRGAQWDYLGVLDVEELLKAAAGSLPFDDILLISDNGTVVYEDKKRGPQFTTLSSLLKARVGAPESKPAGTESQGAGNSAAAGQKPEQAWRDASIHLTDVMLAGTRYKLFLQPILIDIYADEPTQTEPSREWALCGLRSNSALEWEALSISYTVIIWFTALFFAICMGGPVLKVIFMNQRERFRLRELGFLSLFLVLLAGVFTLTALEIVDVRAASATDARLERLAGALSNRVHDDLGQMRDQLLEWCATEELHGDLRDAARREVIRFAPDPKIMNTPLNRTPKTSKYRFVNNAFWTDDNGRQIVKWSTGSFITPMIDVSGQAIYSDPRHIYLDGQGPPFNFDSILPPNKLEYLAALTMATADCSSKLDGIRGDVAGGAAVLTGQPFSLIDPILPLGYGFAVVDNTGRVLFHSDKTKDGRENFREESDWNKGLYAGTFGHATRQPLTVNYLGKDYRARVIPVQGLAQANWSLIVYADLEAERTLALQTMTMASTLLLWILAVPALVAAVWCLWRRPRFAPEWIWPNEHRMTAYVYQICLYSALIVVFLFVGFRGPSEQIVISCAAVPYSALLLTFWCFRRYPQTRYSKPDRRLARFAPLPVALTVLSAAAFLLVLVLHWSDLNGLAALPAVVGIAAVPLLDRPRRYASVWMRRRRRPQPTGEPSGAQPPQFWTHQNCYAASVLLLLLLMGVLTPLALFRGCLSVESRLAVKQTQLHLASALTERRAAILEKCEAGEMGAAACEEFEQKDNAAWEKLVPDPSLAGDHRPVIAPHDARAGKELYEDWFLSLIYLLHHEYNTTAAETLGVIRDRVPPKPGHNFPDWSWENDGPSTVTLRWHGLHPLPSETGLAERDLLIASDVPAASSRAALSGTAIAIGVMLFIGGVLWMLVRKVFLIHLAPLKITGVREVAECFRMGRNVLILAPPASGFDVESATTLDLETLAREDKWAETVDLGALPAGLIAIRRFEHTSDWSTIDQKLIFLSRLAQRENTQVAAIMEVPASGDDYRRKFPLMAVVDLREEPFLWLKQYQGPARDLIWEECRPMAALWPLGAQLAKEIKSETNVLDDTIASEILERADPYYRLIWKECSPEQRFVLSQLAEDGLMNPTNGRAIRQMIRRGLILQDPAFRIMNESFRRFLRSATTLEMKQRWVAESRRSGWGKVHGAFFTTMIVLGVFLLTTQNSLWQSSAAYVTTAFGALGTLAKLFNTYRGAATGEKAN